MNAIEFIKKFGWDDACALVDASRLCGIDKSIVNIIELKSYVGAYELVEKHRGLKEAKKDLIDAKRFGMNMIFGTPLKELKQAITLVEEVQNANN